jgi:phosphoribosyl-AMP cyclohydrolase
MEKVKFNKDGLVAVIAQDFETNEVLMLAYMNEEALKKTIKNGVATYWSRSRQKFWVKGESSGNTQEVKSLAIDCDGDAILMKVVQKGAACHEGYKACFFRELKDGEWTVFGDRLFDPKEVYGEK